MRVVVVLVLVLLIVFVFFLSSVLFLLTPFRYTHTLLQSTEIFRFLHFFHSTLLLKCIWFRSNLIYDPNSPHNGIRRRVEFAQSVEKTLGGSVWISLKSDFKIDRLNLNSIKWFNWTRIPNTYRNASFLLHTKNGWHFDFLVKMVLCSFVARFNKSK